MEWKKKTFEETVKELNKMQNHIQWMQLLDEASWYFDVKRSAFTDHPSKRATVRELRKAGYTVIKQFHRLKVLVGIREKLK